MRPDIKAAAKDLVAQGLSRVSTQYKKSERFKAFLAALLSELQELEPVFWQLMLLADIDKQQGVNLDRIGKWVGAFRIVENAVQLAFFGFEGEDASLPFGEEGLVNIGGRFRDEDEKYLVSNVLPDPEFRVLIRARIARNYAKGSPEDVIAALKFIFSADQVRVEDLGGMRMAFAIGRPLSFFEKVMATNMDILPKPAGVRFSQMSFYNPAAVFGFDDQAGVLGFGEEGQDGGGIFAEEF